MRTNYILVDYQNVHDIDTSILDLEFIRVVVFLGKHEAKLPVDFVCGMQRLGNRATYVQIKSDGKNAVDFVMAYELGRLAVADSSCYFHIISKDKGFDPLVSHLGASSIRAHRWDRLVDALPLKPVLAKNTAERASAYAEIKHAQSNRPKKLKTLRSSIQGMFPTQLEEEVGRIEALLLKRKYCVVEGDKVTYPATSLG